MDTQLDVFQRPIAELHVPQSIKGIKTERLIQTMTSVNYCCKNIIYQDHFI